jgi:hypothetical protein
MEMESCTRKTGTRPSKKLERKNEKWQYKTTVVAKKTDTNEDTEDNKNRVMKNNIQKHINVGTWNVRGTYEEGKLKHIINEIKKFKFDIVALQETKQKGEIVMEIGEYVFLNSGGSNRMLGTGFVIHKRMKPSIVNFKTVSDRVCLLRIRGKYQKITFINFHAPSEEKDVEVKEAFYNELDRIYEEVPRYDIKIMLGDANAKIGREDVYIPTIGRYSKHELTNENGVFLIDFAKEKNMTIISTYFQRKEIYKGTWRSPDGRTINQIDHILIERPEENSIKNVRTYRGPDADTDHFMVGAKMTQSIPEIRNQAGKRKGYKKVIRLKSEEEQIKYEEVIKREMTSVTGKNSIEEKWLELKLIIERAATTCRKEENQGKKIWFDEECKNELENRRKLRLKMLTEETEDAKIKYEQQRRKTKKLLRNKKRKHSEKVLEEIEENYKNNQIRNLYQGIKKEKRGFQVKTVFYKNKNGEIIGGEQEGLDRWVEYFEELLNGENYEENLEGENNIQMEQGQKEDEVPPSKEQITEIIRKLKNNKSPGTDGLTAELFKYGGQRLLDYTHKLIEEIWKKEQIPTEWKQAIICPIHKKGDKSECKNYRGISLLNIAYKIMATHIKNKLIEETENLIGEYQCGFRQGRSTTDQIFVLREIQAESSEYETPTMALFIDFKQAYDKVKRKELYKALEELKVSGKLINMIRLTLQETQSMVRVNNKISEKFEIREGVRQGDPLSSVLFSIVLEKAIRDANINRTGLIYHKKHQCLAFADDLVILTRSQNELRNVVKRLEAKAATMGLYINEEKTKYMEWTDKVFQEGKFLKIDAESGKVYKFKEVDKFTYLGTIFTRKPNIETEIEARIMSGNRCVGALNRILRNKNISRKAKVKVYRTVIRPIVTYACETWTINKTVQTRLEIWERKVLRKIFGGKKIEDRWLRRTNEELKELYKETDIVGVAKTQRLRWRGHIERMRETRVPKQVMSSKLGGKRKRGRPKARWATEVEKDIKILKITRWKEKAKNRKLWRSLINQAMGQTGSQS